MSYDVWLSDARCPHCGRDGESLFSWNYTSNMSPAWREAGANIAEFHGKTAADCAPLLRAALMNMERRPEHFVKFNALNGWGTMDNLIPALHTLLGAMERHPAAVVEVSR